METRYLQEFIAVAHYGNFTKAATALYITQSTLSKHIMALEKELGCKLVERGHGKSLLTPVGSVFLKDARRIVDACDHAVANMEQMKHEKPRDLRVLTFSDDKMVRDILSMVVRRAEETRPLLNVILVDVPLDARPCSLVESGEVDLLIGISDPTLPYGDLTFIPLFCDPEIITVRSSHHLADRASMRTVELDGELIHMPSAPCISEMKSRLTGLLRDHGVEPIYEYYDTEPGQSFYELDFTDGVFAAPLGMVLYNMPASLLKNHTFIRLEDADADIWHYAVYRTGATDADLDFFMQLLKQEVKGLKPEALWNRLPGGQLGEAAARE